MERSRIMDKRSWFIVFIIFLFALSPVIAETTNIKGFWHTVKWGETINGLAEKYNINPYLLAGVNNLDNWNQILAGDTLWIPPNNAKKYRTHTVKVNEHLLGIAENAGVSVWLLARINGIFNLDLIYPGQELIIPLQ